MRPPPLRDFRYAGIAQGTHFWPRVDHALTGWQFGEWLQLGGPVENPTVSTAPDAEVVGRYGFDPHFGGRRVQFRLAWSAPPYELVRPPQKLDLYVYERDTSNPLGFTQTVTEQHDRTSSDTFVSLSYASVPGSGYDETSSASEVFIAHNPFEPWYDMRSFGNPAFYERKLLAILHSRLRQPPNYSPDRYEIAYEWHPHDRLILRAWELYFSNLANSDTSVVNYDVTKAWGYPVTEQQAGYWSNYAPAGAARSPAYALNTLGNPAFVKSSQMGGFRIVSEIGPNTAGPLDLLTWRGDLPWFTALDSAVGYPWGYRSASYLPGAGSSDESPTGGLVTLSVNGYQARSEHVGYTSGGLNGSYSTLKKAGAAPGFAAVSARFRFPRFRWAIRPLRTPPLRQRQRGDGLVLGDQRQYVRGNPKSMQASPRQLWSGTFL